MNAKYAYNVISILMVIVLAAFGAFVNAEECSEIIRTQVQDAQLIIRIDDSKIYEYIDDVQTFLRADNRFQGSGGPSYVSVVIWPEEELKSVVESWKDAKLSLGKYGIDMHFIMKADWEAPNDWFQKKDIEIELEQIQTHLRNGKVVEIPHISVAMYGSVLKLKIPPGRYYFDYRMYLKRANRWGGYRLLPANYGPGPASWGPISMQLQPGETNELNITPYAYNLMVPDVGGPKEQTWVYFLEYLIKLGLF